VTVQNRQSQKELKELVEKIATSQSNEPVSPDGEIQFAISSAVDARKSAVETRARKTATWRRQIENSLRRAAEKPEALAVAWWLADSRERVGQTAQSQGSQGESRQTQ